MHYETYCAFNILRDLHKCIYISLVYSEAEKFVKHIFLEHALFIEHNIKLGNSINSFVFFFLNKTICKITKTTERLTVFEYYEIIVCFMFSSEKFFVNLFYRKNAKKKKKN